MGFLPPKHVSEKRGLSQETSPSAGLSVAERGTETALCTGDGAMTVSLSDVCVKCVCVHVCVLALRVDQGIPKVSLLQPPIRSSADLDSHR